MRSVYYCITYVAANTTKLMQVFTQGGRYFCASLTKSGVSRVISIKVSKIKFHKSPSSSSHADTSRQADI